MPTILMYENSSQRTTKSVRDATFYLWNCYVAMRTKKYAQYPAGFPPLTAKASTHILRLRCLSPTGCPSVIVCIFSETGGRGLGRGMIWRGTIERRESVGLDQACPHGVPFATCANSIQHLAPGAKKRQFRVGAVLCFHHHHEIKHRLFYHGSRVGSTAESY